MVGLPGCCGGFGGLVASRLSQMHRPDRGVVLSQVVAGSTATSCPLLASVPLGLCICDKKPDPDCRQGGALCQS